MRRTGEKLMQRQTLWFNVAAVAATLLAGASAHAQFDPHRLSVRVGATTIIPDVKSGDLSAPSLPGTKIDINSATQLTGGINYEFNDNVSIDVPLGLPFKFKVEGKGAIDGVGEIGTVKALPMTLLAQYRFGTPASMLRPYAGVGVTYSRFFKARSTATLSGLTGGSPSNPTTMSMDNAWGASLQLGLQVPINTQWSVDVAAIHVWLKTTGHLSTGQDISTRLDPTAVTAAVVYRF
jgi:outer membrane protein